jgi:hypothetical protein
MLLLLLMVSPLLLLQCGTAAREEAAAMAWRPSAAAEQFQMVTVTNFICLNLHQTESNTWSSIRIAFFEPVAQVLWVV